MEIEIYDKFGRLVISRTIENGIKVNIKKLKSGVYILRVNKNKIIKFIK